MIKMTSGRGHRPGTTCPEAFRSVTRPVGETEAAGDSPFMDTSWSKKPGSILSLLLGTHPRFPADSKRLLCIGYPVDNKTNPDVSSQSKEDPEVQSVLLLRVSGGIFLSRGSQRPQRKMKTVRHSAVKLSLTGCPWKPSLLLRAGGPQCAIWAALGRAGVVIKPPSDLLKGRSG